LKQFPVEIINVYHKRFFLSLSQNCGNEKNKICLSINNKCLTTLFERSRINDLNYYLELLLSWVKAEGNISLMAVNVILILIKSNININNLYIMEKCINRIISFSKKKKNTIYLYDYLHLLEELWVNSYSNIRNHSSIILKKAWEYICSFYSCKNELIQIIICRIIGYYLQAGGFDLFLTNNTSALITSKNVHILSNNILFIVKNYNISISLLKMASPTLIQLLGSMYYIMKNTHDNIHILLDHYFAKTNNNRLVNSCYKIDRFLTPKTSCINYYKTSVAYY
jgi:hypothetical protein